jgi:hypothetical protein
LALSKNFLLWLAVEKEIESGQLVDIKYKGPKFYTPAQILYHNKSYMYVMIYIYVRDDVKESKL